MDSNRDLDSISGLPSTSGLPVLHSVGTCPANFVDVPGYQPHGQYRRKLDVKPLAGG